MHISVFGTTNKKLISDLTKASEFFADRLMDKRMVKNIELDIELDKNLECKGYCINEDDTRRSRFFTIQLRNTREDKDDMLQTLAHEMVHVKQYAKNELHKIYGTAKGSRLESVWKGKIWRPRTGEVTCFDSPWEIEAYGREPGLVNQWLTYKNGN